MMWVPHFTAHHIHHPQAKEKKCLWGGREEQVAGKKVPSLVKKDFAESLLCGNMLSSLLVTPAPSGDKTICWERRRD